MNPTTCDPLHQRRHLDRVPILAAAASLLIAACFPCAAHQTVPQNPNPAVDESFDEIKIRIATEQAQALEAYLAAHLNASDARAALISLY